jgi:RNA polymerase sigma factor (TIGR02999 family)
MRESGTGDERADGSQTITQLLHAWSRGDDRARNLVFERVYRELRTMAASQLRRERRGHTLQPTALVHEAYLRLFDQRTDWKSRAHFFGIAAQQMRRILLDSARRRSARKRGQGAGMLTLDIAAQGEAPAFNVAALDDALNTLARVDSRQARIVELRYFGGLDNEEIAEVLGISPATVKRDWTMARAWLFGQLRG